MRFMVCLLTQILTITAITVQILSGAGAAQGERISLFNGKDLTGWDGDPQLWSVRDGAIVGQTTADTPIKENTFLIWTGGVLRDFELQLAFRLENHNSGIQYRSRDLGLIDGARKNWAVGGYQADMDEANRYTGIFYEERGRGIIADVGEKVTISSSGKVVTGKVADPHQVRAGIKAKDWNQYLIVCRGNQITHRVNGQVTVEVTDNDPAKRSMEGILAFQLHQGAAMKVEFKDIFLKVLRSEGATH